jgi:hypothetical protein
MYGNIFDVQQFRQKEFNQTRIFCAISRQPAMPFLS